jgi:protein-tyrosine phosphatase
VSCRDERRTGGQQVAPAARRRLLGGARPRAAALYHSRVIDLHCHVLPGIDDGPATLEDSLDLARAAERAGVTTVVATPHVSWRYTNDPEVIRQGVDAVRSAVRAAHIAIDVRPGAEIAVPRLGDLSDQDLCALRLGDGPWLLIEAPLTPAVEDVESVLDAVHRRGHWIVLAHPERSPLFHRHPQRLKALVDRGMLCSITAGSLVGAFGSRVHSFALALAREGLVHNVTSDAHDAVRRPPILRGDIVAAAAQVPELSTRMEWLTCDIPRAILDGDALPRPPGNSDGVGTRRRH